MLLNLFYLTLILVMGRECILVGMETAGGGNHVKIINRCKMIFVLILVLGITVLITFKGSLG